MVLEGGTLEIKLVKLCKYITPGTFKEIIKYKEEVICYFFKKFFSNNIIFGQQHTLLLLVGSF
jgi:hypothetical protein